MAISSSRGFVATLPATLIQVSSVALLLTSILCIALKSSSTKSYSDDTQNGATTGGASSSPDPGFQFYPGYLLPIGGPPVFAAASIGLITSLGVGILSAKAWRSKQSWKINPTRWKVILCLLAFNAGFATAIMVYTNIQAARSVTFDPEYKPPSGTYDKGWFTLEAWTCQVQSSFPDYHKGQFTTQCAGERGSRILIVLVWLLSLGVLGALVWDVKSSKKILCVERRKTMWEEEEEDGEEFDGRMEMK